MNLIGTFSDAIENVPYVPITNGTYAFTVLYSVPVIMKPTEFVLVLAQCEITNPYDFNVGVGRYLCRAASPSDGVGRRIIPANMDNITPDLHHKQIVMWGTDTGAEGLVYYNLVLYAVGFSRCGNLVAEQGYGKVMVLKFQ